VRGGVKASKKSDRQPPSRIVIAARAARDQWHVSVADNGIGIEPQYADRVFQMFQRLHARGDYEGSGIGLAIAKRIVERHGGTIWLQAPPAGGTTVVFALPRVTPPS
jgi:signal transduction histidine kinase